MLGRQPRQVKASLDAKRPIIIRDLSTLLWSESDRAPSYISPHGEASGTMTPKSMTRLTREAIDVAALQALTPADGAFCLFLGVVRNENDGRAVRFLEYEAYEEMALPEL